MVVEITKSRKTSGVSLVNEHLKIKEKLTLKNPTKPVVF